MLHAQDILVTLKLLTASSVEKANYAALAASVELSTSETHAAVQRAVASGLVRSDEDRPMLSQMRPSAAAIHDLLCFGVRYFLPATLGAPGRGILTATSAPPLLGKIIPDDNPPYVWAFARGQAKGVTVTPIYPSAPAAAQRDPKLAEWLALVDALRLNYGRVADLARQEIRTRLSRPTHAAAA